MKSIFDELTPKQREAVQTTKEDLKVIACAGSGKTRVVATRIIYILKNEKAQPENIVAFTYTDKAAKELKSRVYEYAKKELGSTRGFGAMFIGTCHSYCMRLLQDHTDNYKTHTLLDPIKLRLFVEKYWKEIGMRELGLEPEKINRFLESMTILNENPTTNKMPDDLKRAYKQYCKFMIDNKFLDFGLVMRKTDDELRDNADMRKAIQEKLKFLIVDEYQDINPIQESIIQRLHALGPNLCVVGDDDQTIFQFRGSEAKNILEFHKRYAGAKQVYLEENFRCSPAIVKLAEKIVGKNKNRFKKIMNSKADIAYEQGDITWAEFEDEAEEASFITARIKELIKTEKMKYSDIAIICRKRRTIDLIENSLRANSIPYIVDGVNELFHTAEVRAICECFDYLQHKDLPHWTRKEYKSEFIETWTRVHKSITKEDVTKVLEYLKGIEVGKYKDGHEFVIQEIFNSILNTLGFFEDPNNPDELKEVCLHNFGMFSTAINDFESIYYNDEPAYKLERFIDFIDYTAKDKYAEGRIAKSYTQPDAVRIMTVHGAKGLEFPAVFIPGLINGTFPAVNYKEEELWNVIVPKNAVENSKRFQGALEDERKMFYVAVTRAQKLLFLTRQTTYTSKWGNVYPRKQSVFFKEAKKSKFVVKWTPQIKYGDRKLITAGTKQNTVVLNFTFLQKYFECPYEFKLAFMYGFYQPLVEAYGYGKSMRDIALKIHTKKLDKVREDPQSTIQDAMKKYFYTPYATKQTKDKLAIKAEKLLTDYFKIKKETAPHEKMQDKYIEIEMGDNVVASGKTIFVENEDGSGKEYTAVYDIISSSIPEAEAVTTGLLQIRALGLAQANEKIPDYTEVYNLDDMKLERVAITPQTIQATQNTMEQVSSNIRTNKFCKRESIYCKRCFYKKLCKKD